MTCSEASVILRTQGVGLENPPCPLRPLACHFQRPQACKANANQSGSGGDFVPTLFEGESSTIVQCSQDCASGSLFGIHADIFRSCLVRVL